PVGALYDGENEGKSTEVFARRMFMERNSPPWQRRGGCATHKNLAQPPCWRRRGGLFKAIYWTNHPGRSSTGSFAPLILLARPPLLCCMDRGHTLHTFGDIGDTPMGLNLEARRWPTGDPEEVDPGYVVSKRNYGIG